MSYMKNKSYSSFWLDPSIFFDEDDSSIQVTSVERKASDLMKLMAYKRSIANFVNIVTGKSIPVTFNGRGDDSYTDGNSVVISAKLDDKEFDPVVGLALHEGSHIALTDFGICYFINESLVKYLAKPPFKFFFVFNLRNWILSVKWITDFV